MRPSCKNHTCPGTRKENPLVPNWKSHLVGDKLIFLASPRTGLLNDATRKGETKARGGGGEAGERRAIGDWGGGGGGGGARLGEKRISATALLRRGSFTVIKLSTKILAPLRLSVNFFQLRLTKKLKINCVVSKVLPFKRLTGMCLWMGSHFQESHMQFFIFTVSKRTRMFVL